MDVKIEASWKDVLSEEFEKEYFINLSHFVKSEYDSNTIYPKGSEIFNAFNLCPFNDVNVVIIGQDPYHGPNQAHGLCFSVKEGEKLPPSLRNIYKELNNDLNITPTKNGDLSRWAKQGVLLLNATLTVRANEAGSHQKKGWEQFTDAVIERLATKKENLVYLLWGAYARKKGEIIDENKNLILKSVHPSPLSASRGFFGNMHFSKTNTYLNSKGKNSIIW